MDSKTIVIAWLSLQIAVMSFYWMKAEKRVSFLEGQRTPIAFGMEQDVDNAPTNEMRPCNDVKHH